MCYCSRTLEGRLLFQGHRDIDCLRCSVCVVFSRPCRKCFLCGLFSKERRKGLISENGVFLTRQHEEHQSGKLLSSPSCSTLMMCFLHQLLTATILQSIVQLSDGNLLGLVFHAWLATPLHSLPGKHSEIRTLNDDSPAHTSIDHNTQVQDIV